jgi:predicted kinase
MAEVSSKTIQQIHQNYYPFIPNLTRVNERKMLVLFSGIPGSGKTTHARQLERAYHGIRINVDEIRELVGHLGLAETKEKRNQIAKAYVAYCLDQLIAETNHLVIIDASADRVYHQTMTWCKKNDFESYIISLDISKEEAVARLTLREIAEELPTYLEMLDTWITDHAAFRDQATPDLRLVTTSNPKVTIPY